MIDSIGWGYYLSDISMNPTNKHIAEHPCAEGYANTLYFPHHDKYENCVGYWLGSPAAFDEKSVLHVQYEGAVGSIGYSSSLRAFRPVICLPSSEFK